jgi:hypothetical protein
MCLSVTLELSALTASRPFPPTPAPALLAIVPKPYCGLGLKMVLVLAGWGVCFLIMRTRCRPQAAAMAWRVALCLPESVCYGSHGHRQRLRC